MKRILIFCLVCLLLVILVVSIPATLYSYWFWKSRIDPSLLIDADGIYRELSSEELIRKTGSVDPFNPYPSVAIDILGSRKDMGAVPRLIEILNSWNPRRRRTAIRVLGKIGDKKAIGPLLKITKEYNADSMDYKLAVRSLEKLGYEK
ncbi:MAG: HEAT repeat domain-containing protein [Candidatus Omnitrophica bacterium]|nr:HEAT repeat domain-containing protein [Candidatus Omnitrophota bacterium]